jgi:hypothetical protein
MNHKPKTRAKVIGISGNARSAKDTLCALIKEYVELGQGEKIQVHRLAFADAVKDAVDSFCIEQLGISAHTDDPDEKKIIRPILVFWGTTFWRARDPEHWVKAINHSIEMHVTSKAYPANALDIVTDVRFRNEWEMVNRHNSLNVFTEMPNVPPANDHEARENNFLRENADYVLRWNKGDKLPLDFIDVLHKFIAKPTMYK